MRQQTDVQLPTVTTTQTQCAASLVGATTRSSPARDAQSTPHARYLESYKSDPRADKPLNHLPPPPTS